MKISKFFTIFLLLIIFTTPLYAAEPAKIKINFWFSVPHEYLSLMEEILVKYGEEKPSYEIVPRNFDSPQELLDKLLTAHVHPDVALINVSWQKELISKGKIENVEDLMDKVGTSLKVVFKMDTFPKLWDASVYDGKIWTVPFYVSNRVILYNPQILKNNKLKSPPKTWADFVKTGVKITKNDIFACSIPVDMEDAEAGYIFNSFLMQTGGSLSGLNSSQYEKTMTFLNDTVNKYKICSTRGYDPDKTAMFIGKIGDYLYYKKNGINLKAAPMLKDKTTGSYFNLYNLAISSNTKLDPLRVWNFVYWLSEFQQSTIWSLKTSYLPANKQVTLSPDYFQYLQENPEISVFIKELASGKTETGLFNHENIIKSIGKDFKMVISGSKTLEEALHAACSSIKGE